MTPETLPQRPVVESHTVQSSYSLEHTPLLSDEHLSGIPKSEFETKVELASSAAESIATSSLPSILPQPVIDDQVTVGVSVPVLGVEESARDGGDIEKEWVLRAKKIVEDTPGDPYRRGQAVNELQIDYLKKRYGKELHAAD